MNRILSIVPVLCITALGLTACDGSDPGSTSDPGNVSVSGSASKPGSTSDPLRGRDPGSLSDPGSASCPSLNSLITAAGISFNNADPNITEENFPLVCPMADVSDMRIFSEYDLGGTELFTAEYEAAISRQGYRPATLTEMLVWAKEVWDGSGTIVALGSSWSCLDDCGCRVPYLYVDGSERELYIPWNNPAHRWQAASRFLAVRK